VPGVSVLCAIPDVAEMETMHIFYVYRCAKCRVRQTVLLGLACVLSLLPVVFLQAMYKGFESNKGVWCGCGGAVWEGVRCCVVRFRSWWLHGSLVRVGWFPSLYLS